MIDREKQDRLGKIFLSFFAILLISFGVLSLLSGDLNYSNFWGGVVFAPAAILVGVLLIILVLFKKDLFQNNPEPDQKFKTNKSVLRRK